MTLLTRARALALPLLCLAIIASSILRVEWAARHWDSTYDEYWHLLWSERALLEANFEREYSNFVATTPVSMLNAAARHQLTLEGNGDAAALLAAARTPTVVAYAVLLAMVFALGNAIMDVRSGLLAATFTALDPNLMTHGALATVDIYFAVVTLCFLYQGIRFYRSPSLREAILLGLVIGAGFVVKLSTVLFFPVLGLVLLSAAARKGAEHFLPAFFKYGFAGLAVASFVVSAAYQFRETGFFLKDLTIYSSFMTALQNEWPYLYFMLPASFIEGFDQTLSVERVMQWNTVIFDRYITDGAWYYFPVTWFLKTPIAILALLALGAAMSARPLLKRVLPGAPRTDAAATPEQTVNAVRPVLWIFVLQWAIFFVYFNLVFRTHVGLRYILMCLPILYLLCVYALQEHSRSRWQSLLIPVCLVVAFLELWPYRENILSFSNAFISDKKSAWYVLTDSNIDWGQNYTRVFAQADAEYPEAERNPAHIMPGQNIIRLNYLTGVFRNFEQYRWVRENLEPARHLQHTHLLYQVSDEQFQQFLNEQNRAAPLEDLNACNGNVASTLPWQLEAQSTGDQPLCLDAGSGLYSIRVTRGWGVAGRFENGACAGYPMSTGTQVIYKVEEDRGQLCVTSNDVGTVWEVTRRN